ncbi:class I SAM-dependent methyltransferase [Pseudoalteromonas piscicida]|uniref:class I SAM-dependent methyltransferase n=1 Tax=Pseudoalteromonas piscicida TaxID=43662 RepID=UPI0015524108|nr:class I SAM-dependent methyltransferase [Pseudoalteromonas piscicida]
MNQSVASDCTPVNLPAEILWCDECGHYQKLVSAEYLRKVDDIYKNYQPYSLNQGKEQQNFSASIPFTRCVKLIKNCFNYLKDKDVCNYLDIGTGSGAMLQAVESEHQDWTKYAQDISDNNADLLIDKYSLVDFYSSLSDVTLNFDVITLIHVLEHIEDVDGFLTELGGILSNSGIAIIQVPAIEENIWDFAIFDHISHFSRQGLEALLSQYFDIVTFPEEQIAKEITVIVSNPRRKPRTYIRNNRADKHTEFNQKQGQIRSLENVYVLGTGPAACFCASLLGSRLLGFLDEDPDKIGKSLLCKKIFDANSNYLRPIYLPYPLEQIRQIKVRLPQHQLIY